MRKMVFFLATGFFLFISSPVSAQLVLDKRDIKLEVKSGEETSGSITVSNPSNTDVTIKAYFEDLIYTPPYLGSLILAPLDSNPRSCGKWITIPTPMFLVPAKGKQEVGYSIKVPKEAKGGYYAVLLFEKSASPISGEKGIGITERAGCIFSLETADKVRKSKIDDIIVGEDAIQGSFSNLGNVILISQGTFYIMGKDGLVADRGVVNKYYLPPGEKVPFTIKVSDKVLPGKYTLVINVDMEEGKTLIKEVDFSKDKTGSLKILAQRD